MLDAQVWAVIPARGGSKSVPRKNLLEVGGVPLLARAIRSCVSARSIARTIVSTDDREIAKLARDERAEVVTRPCELSGDSAKSEEALLHTLDVMAEASQLPKLITFVQCTSPFLLAEDIDGVVETIAENDADCAFTAARNHSFVWRKTQTGVMTGVNHDMNQRFRRQDRSPEFVETGGAYVMRTKGFLLARHRFFGKVSVYEVPASRALEIDEPDDIVCARLMAPWIDSRVSQHPST